MGRGEVVCGFNFGPCFSITISPLPIRIVGKNSRIQPQAVTLERQQAEGSFPCTNDRVISTSDKKKTECRVTYALRYRLK